MNGDRLLDVVEALRKKCLAREEENRKILRLTETEYKGLLCFESKERIACQEFAVRMNLSVSRGSRVIDRLFAKGYIKRADSSEDRRCKYIWLTPKGTTIRSKIDTQRQICEEILVTVSSEEKIKKLKKELINLTKQFDKV